ncbi:MAG: hypothetical protein JJU07_02800 [Natronohydrobacter sp.]|jgi:hypothetical protein|nr:hypothetical protein [Natronohydrobacter sp.]
MRAMMIAATLLALTACQAQTPEEDTMPEANPTPETCIADQLQHHVGQPLSRLPLHTLPEPVRVIAPMSPVTMDYRLERLNIEHDGKQIITRIYCG